jgi:hypothetical protein
MNELRDARIDVNTDTLPVCHREEESRRAAATASNEPTKTHERLMREELALPLIDLICRLHATV